MPVVERRIVDTGRWLHRKQFAEAGQARVNVVVDDDALALKDAPLVDVQKIVVRREQAVGDLAQYWLVLNKSPL